MSLFKCKMCGGTLELNHDETVGICEYCGTRQTLPKLGDEQKANLYERANHLRRNNEYDKAMGIYEQILNADRTDAESYWSLVLCRYGIEYVEDPASHKRIPTVNRAQFTSIFADEDYKSAIYYADALQKEIYEQEAKEIDDIQKGILAISSREEPFDVFICYKETDANGRRTPDSVLATDLYHQLKQEGFKVFFSRITLEDKLGVEYEPYIFAALNSAKVMVVLSTKPEYFNAVWVKNEWSRYLALIKNGAKKMLIPAYRDMDPYDLPEEFSHLQAQDMSKLGFMQDLIRGIKKIVSSETAKPAVKETVVISGAANANAAPLLRRVFIFLEDGDFANADEYCEKVLDMEPENAEAYLGKMMAELRVRKREDLALFDEPFDENANYKRALRFADEAFAEELRGYIYTINERKENRRLESLYRNCVRVMETSKTEEDYINAAKNFEELGSFGSSAEMANRCRAKAEEIKTAKLDVIYNNCIAKMNSAKTETDYKKTADLFKKISGYRDADEMAMLCLENAEKAKMQGIYASAKAKMSENKAKSYVEAIDIFRSISAFGDSENQIAFCQSKIEELKVKEAEERLENERKAELKKIADQKRRENAKRLAKIWAPIVAGVLAFAILLNYVVIPNFDYIKAEINTMVEEAKAEKARKDAEKAAAKAEKENPQEETPEEESLKLEGIAIGNIITFGSYEQDNNLENGAEPIEWQILDVQDGKALVISKYGLELRVFDQSKRPIAWDISQARDWLNSDFIEISFSEKEQEMIAITELYNNNNDKYGTKGGNDTEDKVFLLSIEEAEKYFSSDAERQCKPSDKVKELALQIRMTQYESCWWLRSPGKDQKNVAFVNAYGEIDETGAHKSVSCAFRPAMWISVSEEPQETVVSEEISVGDIITLGTWQQKTNPNSGKHPIEWQVLDIQDGKALVLSKYIIEAKYIKESSGWLWETSDFRNWLNNDFFNEAFSSEEQDSIFKSTIKNPANPKSGKGGGKDTTDKVFLLSYEEIDKYFPTYEERKAESVRKVADINLDIEWCMRTKAIGGGPVHISTTTGLTQYDDGGSWDRKTGLRPAMWIEISEEEQQTETVLLSEATVGDYVIFGSYEQDNNLENGTEPIEWKVLDVQDGKALVISKYGLDCKQYHETGENIYWKESTLRTWLNEEFLNSAFSGNELSCIFTSHVTSDKHPDYSYETGEETQDKIFILSIAEAEKYFSSADSRNCIATDYAAANGAYCDGTNGDCYWWLRTAGEQIYRKCCVGPDGSINLRGQSCDYKYVSVRPAMWIEISDEEQTKTVSHSEATVGDYVIFGSYEQDNNLENGAEPIEWKVLDVQDGKALVISKYGLDCKPYNTLKTDITWETCSLRKWLNSDFINEAFGAKEQQNIAVTKLSNQDNPKTGTKGGKDTEDKVFLLDFVELRTYFDSDNGKQCKATKYAIEKGATKDFEDNCYWWLRSPGVNKNTAIFVDMSGRTNNGVGTYNQYAYCTVRPAMWVDLSAVE